MKRSEVNHELRLWHIPSHWIWVTTGELTTVVGGGTPRTSDPTNFEGGDIPWITPADLSGYTEKMISHGARNITAKGLNTSGATMMPAGTVLFSSRAPIGYVAIAAGAVSTNQGFKSFVPGPAISSDFLYYYLQLAKSFALELAGGTTFQEISGANAARLPVPIAPLREQRQIVAEIEKQFTRLDAATAALKRVQSNLKRYRASVLKAACEGRLVPTEAELARKEGRDYEPADQLLKRILRERRARWEAETLAKMIAGGKRPTDDRWKGSYKEPVGPDSGFAFDVPEGWCIASMDQMTSRITSGSRDWSKYYDRGKGVFVMAQNVRPGKFDLSIKQYVDPPQDDAGTARCQIERGDLLVTIVGANTGDLCLVPDSYPDHYVCQSVALMRPVLPELADYMEMFMNSDEHGQRVYGKYIYGAGRPHLSFDQLKGTPVLLPPAREAERIVQSVQEATPSVVCLTDEVGAQLKRATNLRRSVLASAFSGQLVPQDPADEPASVLLERIRQQRDVAKPTTPRLRRSKEPSYA